MVIKSISEEQLHKQICTYIKLQYPKVLFNTDLAGLKMTMGQAKKMKALRSNKGFPDLMILQTGGKTVINHEENDLIVFKFAGLFLELKRETPFKKDGKLKKDNHLEEQQMILERLRKQGYLAVFCWNFDDAKKIIDNYLSL